MDNFKSQLDEDIKNIRENYLCLDKNLENDSYAFNFWILAKIYNIDEEIIPSCIIEYNDRGIDCYVHFEEAKQLYLIQNKFYKDQSNINSNEASKFLNLPIELLNTDIYKRSPELQEKFQKIKDDPDYEIFLHLYISNNNSNAEVDKLFNASANKIFNFAAQVFPKLYKLNELKELYFGESFKEDKHFKFPLITTNKGTILRILPKEYKLDNMSETYYIFTPVIQLYQMYVKSKIEKYPLFEENIREY